MLDLIEVLLVKEGISFARLDGSMPQVRAHTVSSTTSH